MKNAQIGPWEFSGLQCIYFSFDPKTRHILLKIHQHFDYFLNKELREITIFYKQCSKRSVLHCKLPEMQTL